MSVLINLNVLSRSTPAWYFLLFPVGKLHWGGYKQIVVQRCYLPGFAISFYAFNPPAELQKSQEKRRKEEGSWRDTCWSAWQPLGVEQWSVRLPWAVKSLVLKCEGEKVGFWLAHSAAEARLWFQSVHCVVFFLLFARLKVVCHFRFCCAKVELKELVVKVKVHWVCWSIAWSSACWKVRLKILERDWRIWMMFAWGTIYHIFFLNLSYSLFLLKSVKECVQRFRAWGWS